ncbi:MAG: response regulator [Moorea sp. SIO4G2]|uniref:response regulator n=1 Tax=unclassified Moorena TaxID=2683338 RepID=UPI0013F7D55C|nr:MULTISPECIES: response regulator [unclassified Moorena]NEO17052.1 response regulator [Moorena sp. SIO3E8]NEO59342.1 response regulator [Moorena sp. SIO4G2]NEQ03628.1 response regulator [Moorena sp. SIO3F7]NEQ62566.1 response regulator [Moorena sp. SIO4A1]
MSTKCILLIDDEETIQEVVQVGLELETDWEVLTASSGLEGIAMAKTKLPDAILLDVMMPDLDGIATFSKLKANSKTQSIPVIFLTAKTQIAEQHPFKKIGIAGVIIKPFNSITLAIQIAELLEWKL